jgi:hypothetical protein
MTKFTTEEARAIVVGSVRWRAIPVSPVTPFRVKELVLPGGGSIVTAVGTVPPVGTVIVLAPLERVLISTWPGLLAFDAAGRASVPTTSPEYVIVITRVAVTAILIP